MDTTCSYRGNREEMLIAYLYDAAEPGERATFEAHLAGCMPCRQEIEELRLVRTELAQWAPPEPAAGWLSSRATTYGGSTAIRRNWASTLREIPAWAQVAAAVLVLGVAAGAANLNVKYDDSGLTVRTGWLSPSTNVVRPGPAAPTPISIAKTDAAPWRAELAALERQLRNDLQPAVATGRERDSAADAALLRRVRALIEESEKKQMRELALRIAETTNQRYADLRNIQLNFGSAASEMRSLALQQQEIARRVGFVR
jgi:putative zinc finger protein